MNHAFYRRGVPARWGLAGWLCLACAGLSSASVIEDLQATLLGASLSATTGLPGDINGDGKVNTLDLQRLAASWNKQLGQAGYDAECDLNGDDKVNVMDLQIMAANWGREITVTVSIQKNPLGQSTGFSGAVVGKVYVPSRYGGRLTVSGAGVQLIYTDCADLQPVVAQRVYQGDLSGSVVAQGNPCVHTVPSGQPGWYYIRFTQATPVTISSNFVEGGQAGYRPWNGWWWPFAASSGPTLYNFNGPLDKYDRVWGTTARSREQLVQGSGDGWWGHCWGWSIAAILIPQPQATSKNGISFTRDDMEGLYTELADNDPYVDLSLSATFIHWGPPSSTLGQSVDYGCDDLHRILRICIREDGVPVQSDMRVQSTSSSRLGEVWNHSIYKYSASFREVPGSNNERYVEIDMQVWANNDAHGPPTDDVVDRFERYIYRLEYDASGAVIADAGSQNWISASHWPPRDLFRLTGAPWTSRANPYITKSGVDGLYQP